MAKAGAIRIGVGGWTYAPWRGTFYPKGLAHKDELAHAGRTMSALEINGTFYRSQRPETFAKWRGEVPDGFVFTVKAPRYATNRKVLADAGESVERFVFGGLTELGDALGPILWQLPETKRYDEADFAAFLALLPDSAGGRRLRHAVELRHDSFRVPEVVALARRAGVAIVWARDSRHPEIADLCADFAYVRLLGTREDEAKGYDEAALDRHAESLAALARGTAPSPACLAEPAARGAREVFAFVIGGHKAANPAAATSLIERLG
ncbi:DUF72 domain-containing protein [Acuticoccus sp.]|uniref:DUF72 domain-containing protein n=1 Tax=Acuticoccus sp. TaxID=1904378 RepID=UPI003B520A85